MILHLRSALLLPAILLGVAACAGVDSPAQSRTNVAALCTEAWYRSIEAKVPTGDGQGHGPDVGSDEWKSVVEFKLGIRGDPKVPGRDSEAWCRYIDQMVR